MLFTNQISSAKEKAGMKVLVAYDGTLHAKTALKYGLRKVREAGGDLTVLHVFNRNMFIHYEAIPQAEDIARKESARHVEEAEKIIKQQGNGMKAGIVVQDGNPEKEIVAYAKAENIDIILSPRRFRSIIRRSPCPVSFIPGEILIPIDNKDDVITEIDQIAEEAALTVSRVVLLGIVPVHIYSRWERTELDLVKRETSEALMAVGKMLTDHGIENRQILRSGYPDEEIIRAADECTLSMIMYLSGNRRPSELNKAVHIILDEPRRLRAPLLSRPATG